MTDRFADDDASDDSDELALEPGEDADEFADEARAHAAGQDAPPDERPAVETAAPTFYAAGLDALLLQDFELAGRPSVLERLGPAHFRSKGFSFMGFLQTVYDHVAEQSRPAPPADTETPGD